MDNSKLIEMMECISRWLRSGEPEFTLELTLCRTGLPDEFLVRFDRGSIGMLIMMLCSDPDLHRVALTATVKHLGEMDPGEMEAALEELRSLCEQWHAALEEEPGKEAEAKVLPLRKIYS